VTRPRGGDAAGRDAPAAPELALGRAARSTAAIAASSAARLAKALRNHRLGDPRRVLEHAAERAEEGRGVRLMEPSSEVLAMARCCPQPMARKERWGA